MKHYVYKITNTINGKYYIGKHSGNIFENNYWGSGKVIQSAIRKYGKENFSREIIKEFDNEIDAYNFESEIVNELFINSDETYNIIPGGIGYSSGKLNPNSNGLSESHKENISKNHARYWKGKVKGPLSEEHRQQISNNHSRYWEGKSRPNFAGDNHPCKKPEVRKKISKNNARVWLGKKRPEMSDWMFKNHPNKKSIYQIDKTTNKIINEFESAAEAERQLGGIYASNITSVLNGRLNTTGGYKWKYVNTENE